VGGVHPKQVLGRASGARRLLPLAQKPLNQVPGHRSLRPGVRRRAVGEAGAAPGGGGDRPPGDRPAHRRPLRESPLPDRRPAPPQEDERATVRSYRAAHRPGGARADGDGGAAEGDISGLRVPEVRPRLLQGADDLQVPGALRLPQRRLRPAGALQAPPR